MNKLLTIGSPLKHNNPKNKYILYVNYETYDGFIKSKGILSFSSKNFKNNKMELEEALVILTQIKMIQSITYNGSELDKAYSKLTNIKKLSSILYDLDLDILSCNLYLDRIPFHLVYYDNNRNPFAVSYDKDHIDLLAKLSLPAIEEDEDDYDDL